MRHYRHLKIGVSYAVVAAIVTTIMIAAGLVIAMYLFRFGSTVVGTPQASVLIQKLSASGGYEILIKNIGSVDIVKIEYKIYETANPNNVVEDKTGNNAITLAGNNVQNPTPIKQGQEAIITCSPLGYSITISGYSNPVNTGECDIIGEIYAGRSYTIAVRLYFANGQTRDYVITLTAT